MQSGEGRRTALKAALLVILVALGLVVAGRVTAEPSSATPRVIEALDSIRNLTRPGQDGYAAIWEGDKYVQCHALSDQSLSCEAAGAMMQPSLERVLSPDRKQRLTSLGWRLDPSFGAYTQVFPPSLSLDKAADQILAVLSQAYEADLTFIEVQTRWVARQACPPRRGLGQNLAGLVDDSPMMATTAVHGCAYGAAATPPAATLPAIGPAATSPAAASLGGINLLAGSRAASPPSTTRPVVGELLAEVVAAEAVAADPVGDDVEAFHDSHARRGRHPRISSGRRRSTGARRSRSGGHGSHHK